MIEGIHKGDIGTRIWLDCHDDLSGALVAEIHVVKPDRTGATWPATVDGTGVYYVTQADDIDQAGRWTLQAYVELAAWQGHGDTEVMVVAK